MSTASLFFIALVTLLIVACPSSGEPIIFMFGDSNSDTGGGNAAYGKLPEYPYGCIFPNPPSNRASNGRLIIDFLCENVSTGYLKPYLDVFESNFCNGANFAISGSSATYLGLKLSVQVDQLNRFKNRSLELQSKGSRNLINEAGFENAVYIIDIGQNDLAYAFYNSSDVGKIDKKIADVKSAIKSALEALYKYGARRLWIHNTGPLGCLPGMIATTKNATDLDKNGCIAYLNDGAQKLNENISMLCDEMRREMKDATIVYVDMYAIKYDLIANYDLYGFKNPLVACYNSTTGDTCLEQFQYISWDGIHYTEAANAIFALKVASANYSTPPIPFNVICSS